MNPFKILVVDDDPHICDIIFFALEKANMQVCLANNGIDALARLTPLIDLIILDINMPEMDGLSCCREIRKTSEVPILFLSSRDDEIDRILGLEIGGDDYVTKPFSPRELVARISAILKRTKQPPAKIKAFETILKQGFLSLDNEQHQIEWKNQSLALTATEFAILKLFMARPKQVFSRDMIMNQAYSLNIQVSDRTIDSHIRHIRQKLNQVGCQQVIETVHGVGYKLSSCQ